MIALSVGSIAWSITRTAGVQPDEGHEDAEGKAQKSGLEDAVPLEMPYGRVVPVREGEELEDLEEDRDADAEDEEERAKPVRGGVVLVVEAAEESKEQRPQAREDDRQDVVDRLPSLDGARDSASGAKVALGEDGHDVEDASENREDDEPGCVHRSDVGDEDEAGVIGDVLREAIAGPKSEEADDIAEPEGARANGQDERPVLDAEHCEGEELEARVVRMWSIERSLVEVKQEAHVKGGVASRALRRGHCVKGRCLFQSSHNDGRCWQRVSCGRR